MWTRALHPSAPPRGLGPCSLRSHSPEAKCKVTLTHPVLTRFLKALYAADCARRAPAGLRPRPPVDRARDRAPPPCNAGAPPAPPRTNRTRRVPHPVLIGHAASLTPLLIGHAAQVVILEEEALLEEGLSYYFLLTFLEACAPPPRALPPVLTGQVSSLPSYCVDTSPPPLRASPRPRPLLSALPLP